MRHVTALCMFAWLSFGGAGCALFGTEQDEAAKGPEAVIEANVKKALIGAQDVDGAAIGIIVEGGRVTLDGFVANAAERRRAEQLSERVEGVEQVINRIEVRGGD
ncbi:MAG: BON domain-containing protein [Thiohalobacteraceae bacterium]